MATALVQNKLEFTLDVLLISDVCWNAFFQAVVRTVSFSREFKKWSRDDEFHDSVASESFLGEEA